MSSCGWCRKYFKTDERLRQHQKSTGHLFCQPCDRHFSQSVDLQNHRPDCRGWDCAFCDSHFTGKNALRNHQKSAGHGYCGDCGQFFEGIDSLREHQHTTQHASEFRCCDCNRGFKTSDSLKQHLENKVHAPSPSANECVECNRKFRNKAALRQHLKNKVHNFPLSSSANKCVECKRTFKSQNALHQHRDSVAHRPISDLRCIGTKGCQSRFKCPSAMLHHLESGACSSGMTRERLNALILTNDRDRIISSADCTTQGLVLEAMKRLSGRASLGSASPSTASGSVIFTPTSGLTSAIPTPLPQNPPFFSEEVMRTAIARGSPTRCPLCPQPASHFARKPFRTQEALRQHVDSPAHAPQIFNCPAALSQPSGDVSLAGGMAPSKRFSTVSGLTQHVESGACRGGNASLGKVATYVEARLRDMGMDTKLIA